MSAITAIDMATLSSGIPREQLAKLTWAEVDGTRGMLRMAVIMDLNRNEIRPEVRLNPDVLKKFKPKATSIKPEGLGDFHYELTTDWQSVSARFANALVAAKREDVNLGARGMTTETTDEYGLIKAPPRSHQGFPNLIEIRMPSEAGLVIATS